MPYYGRDIESSNTNRHRIKSNRNDRLSTEMKKYPEYKGLNLPNIAAEVLADWQENKIFEKSIESREENKPFVFFEGPPSANGMPGIHHVMARSIKDIFCRYQTLKGFQVKRIHQNIACHLHDL